MQPIPSGVTVNRPTAATRSSAGTWAVWGTITASPPYPGALVTAIFPYTCTYSAPPRSLTEVNTATATWDPSTHVPNDSYQYTQPFWTSP